MDASIEVLSSSLLPLQNSCIRARPSTVQLNARVRVLPENVEEPPFKRAKLTLYGAIKSNIGARSGLEKIVQVSTERVWSDFRSAAKGSPESYFDVAFDILPKLASGKRSFLPSFSVTGETYVTTSDVLSSQQLVKGKCEMIYWIEAEFSDHLRPGHVHRMKIPVDISSVSAPMQLQVCASFKDSTLKVPMKPLKRAMLKRGWPLKPLRELAPKITVSVPRDLGFVYGATTKSYANYQLIAVPITFVITQPTPYDPYCTDITGKFLLNASVEASWFTTKTFSTTNLSGQNMDKNTVHAPRITAKTVVRQKQWLNFPPFYQEKPYQTLGGDANSKFSGTAMLELLLPDTIHCPSVNADLLKVSYELELVVSVDSNETNGAVPCVAKLKIPVMIKPA